MFGFSFKTEVEATHWSRKKGFSARKDMDIRAPELMFHGAAEWSLRILSHGRQKKEVKLKDFNQHDLDLDCFFARPGKGDKQGHAVAGGPVVFARKIVHFSHEYQHS